MNQKYNKRNWVFATNSNLLIPIFLHSDGANLWYYKLTINNFSLSLFWANQRNYFENATACCKRTLKTRVATQLMFACVNWPASKEDVYIYLGMHAADKVLSMTSRDWNNFTFLRQKYKTDTHAWRKNVPMTSLPSFVLEKFCESFAINL